MRCLAEALKIPLPYAVGVMEMLWQFTAKFAPAGDIGKFDNDHIAKAIFWPKSPDLLIAALVKCRWLDPDSSTRYLVHDWKEHADRGVRQKLQNAKACFHKPSGNSGADNVPRHGSGSGSGRDNGLPTAIEVKPDSNANRARENETPQPAPEPEPPPIQPELLAPPTVNGNGNGHSNGSAPKLQLKSENPETARAVHEFFPECDERFVRRLVLAAGQAYTNIAQPACAFSDQLTAEAVRTVYKPYQNSAGLFLSTVPECIRTWAAEGRQTQNEDGEVHY